MEPTSGGQRVMPMCGNARQEKKNVTALSSQTKLRPRCLRSTLGAHQLGKAALYGL